MPEKPTLPNDYNNTLVEIKERVKKSRYSSLRAVNKELIKLYWDIGRVVSEKTKAGWGSGVVKTLAGDLQAEFAGVKGFSSSNISYMKAFYETYQYIPNIQQVVGELPWGQNIVLFTKVKDSKERAFYAQMCLDNGWSRLSLTKNIKDDIYSRYLNNQNNFTKTISVDKKAEIAWQFKDEYNLDFLSLEDEHKEKELEEAILKHMSKTLSQFGKDFCFMGRQFRLELSDKEYFIDLLFYHRKLKCLVAIELKSTEFEPRHSQQLNWYLHLLDKQVKYEDDNPSIGILLCRDKDRITVEYALEMATNPMGVATYSYSQLPEEVAKYLPNEQELNNSLTSDFDA